MKAYVIVSSEHLVQFAWHDDEFLNKLKRLAEDNPGSDQPSDDPVENGHIIEALLSPIVLSYSLLQNNFNDACTVISCKKADCNLVFQQHHDLLYLGFCKTGEFSIYHMQKQLHVLHEMMEFLFGPCQQNINPRNVIDKSRNWKKLTHALNSFVQLHHDEQSFLAGGVERLHLSADLLRHYSNIVDAYIKFLAQGLKNERITFGLLIAKNKIVAYEVGAKSKHKISTADMLKITILVNSKHKEIEEIDLLYDSSAIADDFELSWSDDDDDSLEQNLMYGTSFAEADRMPKTAVKAIPFVAHLSAALCASDATDSSPASSGVGSPQGLKSTLHPSGQRKRSKRGKVRHSVLWNGGPAGALLDTGIQMTSRGRGNTKSLDRDAGLRSNHRDTLHVPENELDVVSLPENDEEETEMSEPLKHYLRNRRKTCPDVIPEEVEKPRSLVLRRRNMQTYPVFLDTASCRHAPFLMHLVPIMEDVTFVVLGEMAGGDIANVICKFLSHLKRIQFVPESNSSARGSLLLKVDGGMETCTSMSTYCKKLKSQLKLHSSDLQLQRVIDLWERSISRSLLAHFKQQMTEDVHRLEQKVAELSKKLQKLFERLFLVKPNKSKKEWKKQLDIVQKEMETRLKDHRDFLIAKSCRNLSISWTHSQYPGLLHFVLVRRMKAASFAGASSGGSLFADEFFSSGLYAPQCSDDDEDAVDNHVKMCLKNQVWRGIMAAYSKLSKREGISEFSLTEGDFSFTSFFWARPLEFQSTSAARLDGSQGRLKAFPWAGKASISGVKSPFWSIKSIEGGTGPFLFFDLHLVHFSTVPRTLIKEQGNRLVGDFRSNKVDV